MRETLKKKITKVKYLDSDLISTRGTSVGMAFVMNFKNLLFHIYNTSENCQNPTFSEVWRLTKGLQQSKKYLSRKADKYQ